MNKNPFIKSIWSLRFIGVQFMSTNLIYAELPRETLCGKGVLKRTSDPKVIENYVRDESVIIIGNADEVVFPRDEKQIAEVLKEAFRHPHKP